MTLKRTPEQKYISHSNFSVATTNGRQPIAPLFEGVGHEHRQRPLVLQSLTSMSSTQNFGLAASQQDCSVQPLQSPKVAFPRTLGNVLQYKSFFSLYSPQMTSHIIIIWPLFYWCQKIVWIPPKECEIIIWFFLTLHTICLLSIKKIYEGRKCKVLNYDLIFNISRMRQELYSLSTEFMIRCRIWMTTKTGLSKTGWEDLLETVTPVMAYVTGVTLPSFSFCRCKIIT